jgi:O-antigen ligase
VQLVPVPVSWWTALPGHQAYATVLDAIGASGVHSLTLNPRATEYAWLALLPCLAIFLAVGELDRRQLRRLVMAFIAVAVAEGTLGILQVGAAPGSPVLLDNKYGGGAATGTYINKNHFASLMAMALPMLVALWAMELRPPVNSRGERLREHPRRADAQLALRILLGLAAVLLLAALLFTRSRAGIACGLAALAAASLALPHRSRSLAMRVVPFAIGAAAFALAAYVGLTPIVEKFAPNEISLGYEGRSRLASATASAALDFLPIGSGLGTFADIFPRYQADRLPGYVDHAHNDYLEAFLELGVAGLAVMVLIAIAYAARWRRLARDGLRRSLSVLQAGAGFAMAAVFVHGLFDFNFHIPANAIYLSFLAGIFFLTPAGDRA